MLQPMFRHLIKQGMALFVLFAFYSSLNSAVAAPQNIQIKKFTLAQELAQKGEIDQAITAYIALIKENPQLPEAYNNLAALYLKKNNTKQAKDILEQGLHAHKGYGVLYDSLTAINVAMAREAYSKALQIELKPADIQIASLSLNDNEKHKKNTIVISDVAQPVVNNKVQDVRPVTDIETSSVVKRSDEIRRPAGSTKLIVPPESVEKIIQAWSAAWSAQATDMYLSFYHQNYKPANGLSRHSWEQSRRLKLTRPDWIKVALSDFQVEKNDGQQAVVQFRQSYQSDRYRDVSTKRMVLLYTDDGWRIAKEKSI